MIPALAGNLLLAAVPSLLLLAVFYRREKRLHDVPGLVFRVFGAGCLSLVPAFLAGYASRGLAAGLPAGWRTVWLAFVTAGLVEESAKYLTVRLTTARRPELAGPLDGVVYTVSAGLGFAFFENVFFIGETPLVLLRALTAVPLHAASAAVLGWFIGRARANPGSSALPGLTAATLLHGTYDLLLMPS